MKRVGVSTFAKLKLCSRNNKSGRSLKHVPTCRRWPHLHAPTLGLRINVLSGKIPRQLGKLAALQSLDLSLNALEGDGVLNNRRCTGVRAARTIFSVSLTPLMDAVVPTGSFPLADG